jgi:hypothetical protein
VLTAASCGEPRPTALQRGELSVRRVEVGGAPADADGMPLVRGDWILEGPALRVVVGGPEREPSEQRGAILEAVVRGIPARDGVVLVAPRVHVGRRRYPVELREAFAVERDGRPALRLEGLARVQGRDVAVARELAIGREPYTLSITTRVEPLDAEGGAMRIRPGVKVAWGGATPWLPDVGLLGDEAWHDAHFVATENEGAATLFGFLDGPLRLIATYEAHGAARFLRDTEIIGSVRDAARGAPAYERAVLVVAPGGIGQAARRLGWARGRPFPEVLVRLPYAPPGALVRIATARGDRSVMRARPGPAGEALVPLPPLLGDDPGPLVALALAPGHAPSDAVVLPAPLPPGAQVRVEIPRGGRIRITARDPSGGRIAARARIVGIEGHKSPELGPDWSASGAGDSVVMGEGEAVVPVPPGTYRVLVSRGPEWSLHEERVVVSETFRPDVRAVLSHVVDPGPWVPCDLHLHAAPSPDSRVSLQDRVLSLLAEGIRFAAATDHNHITSYDEALRALTVDPSALRAVPGVEATTWAPNFGHFNAFPLRLDPALPGNGAPAWEATMPVTLFAALRGIGDPAALVQVNHPRLEGDIGYFDLVAYDPATGRARGPYSADFDLLEVWNGYDLARLPNLERLLAEWLAMVARFRRVVATGSSDSHAVRYVWAGYPRTYVRSEGGSNEPEAVVAALRAGRAFVTSGPMLDVDVEGFGPGEVALARGGHAQLHVVVRAPPWMDVDEVVVHTGRGVAVRETFPGLPVVAAAGARRRAPGEPSQAGGVRSVARSARAVSESPPLPVVRFDRVLEIPVDGDTPLVVVARGTRPMDDYFGRHGIVPLAFTNPVWVDGDGDGRVPEDPGDPRPAPGTFEAVSRVVPSAGAPVESPADLPAAAPSGAGGTARVSDTAAAPTAEEQSRPGAPAPEGR